MKKLTKIVTRFSQHWEEALKLFLKLKEAQGKAPRTLKDYQYHVSLFFSQYPSAWGDFETLRQAILDYFAASAKLAADTYNTRRKCLKAFFRWCVEEGILHSDPMEGIKARKTEGRIRDIPEEILQKLLQLPDRSTYTGLRDYALLLLSLDTGIRPSEALALMPEDINLSSFEVHIRPEVSKTGKPRTLPISPETAAVIRKLLAVRPEEWKEAPVFCSCDGRPLSTNGWRLRLDRYKKQLGQDISPYDLRHVFALLYLRNRGDAFHLQRTMGHASMEMTRRYLQLTQADLQEAHSQASPLNRLLPRKLRVRRIKPQK